MQKIFYNKLWPGGNITALVEGISDRSKYATISNEIMATDTEVEQVGFIEVASSKESQIRLQMMGGEFCGNAARSAGFLFAKRTNCDKVTLEVSGLPCGLGFVVKEDGNTTLEIPGNFFRKVNTIPGGYLVDLIGIRHLIILQKNNDAVMTLVDTYKEDFPALGVIYAKEMNGEIVIDPTVWVRNTNTLIAETGCGSGSIAVAIVWSLFAKAKESFTILQPSGEKYTINLISQDGGESQYQTIELCGTIKILGNKFVEIKNA
ncbi:MAG: hypothetical protein Q7K39_01810 [Candidatus Magasanikbacteria bacterium]|nr:hypothetical protein [Candidatus Magasanikbacteria bacterium]